MSAQNPADAEGVRIIALESTAGVPPLRALVRNARAVARLYRGRRYDRVFLPEWTGLGSALPRSSPLLTNLATGVRLANEVSRLRLRDLPPSRRPAALVPACAPDQGRLAMPSLTGLASSSPPRFTPHSRMIGAPT